MDVINSLVVGRGLGVGFGIQRMEPDVLVLTTARPPEHIFNALNFKCHDAYVLNDIIN